MNYKNYVLWSTWLSFFSLIWSCYDFNFWL